MATHFQLCLRSHYRHGPWNSGARMQLQQQLESRHLPCENQTTRETAAECGDRRERLDCRRERGRVGMLLEHKVVRVIVAQGFFNPHYPWPEHRRPQTLQQQNMTCPPRSPMLFGQMLMSMPDQAACFSMSPEACDSRLSVSLPQAFVSSFAVAATSLLIAGPSTSLNCIMRHQQNIGQLPESAPRCVPQLCLCPQGENNPPGEDRQHT
jgi:hypothetical protein